MKNEKRKKKKEKVSLFKGDSRYQNVLNSLKLIEPEIKAKLEGKKKVLIKPNCVSDSLQLASVHVDVIRAVLDFITKFYKGKIILAEGSAYSTETAFKNFNYFSLKNNYDLDFVDLNNDEYGEIEIYDRSMDKIKVGISKTLLDADCVISLALLKTHDSAISTFGIKNVAVGGLIKHSLFSHRVPGRILRKVVNRITETRNDKFKIHQGPKIINKNIFEIYKKIKPDISIIDGFEGMEGDGPIDGVAVSMKLAISGINAVAVDMTATQLIGLKPEEIGYLYYCMEQERTKRENVEIVGNTSIEKEKKKFKMHRSFEEQKGWRD